MYSMLHACSSMQDTDNSNYHDNSWDTVLFASSLLNILQFDLMDRDVLGLMCCQVDVAFNYTDVHKVCKQVCEYCHLWCHYISTHTQINTNPNATSINQAWDFYSQCQAKSSSSWSHFLLSFSLSRTFVSPLCHGFFSSSSLYTSFGFLIFSVWPVL